ncbi:FKBP-type peptidyl-prolyl cis-trans isomerase [Gallaecimonas pentaromativorans]|uniref:Peptidyl-prolyl cis-trans isomerase n=1 Tax=Gallaecimonas pentaromativorans TaxID=584787 RepID=A0A3N1P792_9GAMM|nr:peptidylprolyl isomerase [Gallaecimonas pentaromativorans]MED5525090.1 peptidylprolyl isomerase [Pseudomonadota bacterium]ROQ22630.1 FKBP-type peptidyl-prolyl cis-trans isomerase SlyD [Gallaecimonas pentaromativorans]
MQITDDKVVQFHYQLKDETGKELENSNGQEPLAYLHGHDNMIPGLEKAMEGKAKGDTFTVTLAPEDAYGERRDGLTQRVPIKHLQGAKKWAPGMVAVVNTDQGQRQVLVVKAGRFMADVDLNHPLAGKTLTFDIEILDIRDASDDEVAHGHAHGVGGHQH